MVVKKEISLLPDAENVNSLSSRALKWVATAGRFIIVITELIVIIALFSRFKLDATNSELSAKIRQQKAIIDSMSDFEKEFTSFQSKLKVVKDFYANNPQYDQKLRSIADSTPPDIVYDSLAMYRDQKLNQVITNATVYALKEDSVVDYLTNLTVNPDIQSVNIQNIEKKSRENKYTINLSLAFKTPEQIAQKNKEASKSAAKTATQGGKQ